VKKVLLGFGMTLVTIFLIALISGGVLWSHRNTAVSLEERIKAQYVSNQSNYDSMWKSLKEMTQVTDIQAQQFKDVYTGLIEGRNQDQNLLFKAIKEQNPQLDTKVYTGIQREISANRKTFDNNQKQIADIIREYNTYIQQKPVMTMITGRKDIDAKDYVVTSDKTDKAFKNGKDEEINLTGKENK